MKNRALLKAVVFLVLWFSLSGCDLDWQRYTNREHHFSILLPRSWQKEQGVYNTVLLAKAPFTSKLDKFQENINVVVTQLPGELKLSTFFELNKDELMRNLAAISNVLEGEIYAGFMPGKWLSFESRMKELNLKIIVAMWMKDKRVYTITFGSQVKDFAKYEPIFNKIVRSLRIN